MQHELLRGLPAQTLTRARARTHTSARADDPMAASPFSPRCFATTLLLTHTPTQQGRTWSTERALFRVSASGGTPEVDTRVQYHRVELIRGRVVPLEAARARVRARPAPVRRPTTTTRGGGVRT